MNRLNEEKEGSIPPHVVSDKINTLVVAVKINCQDFPNLCPNRCEQTVRIKIRICTVCLNTAASITKHFAIVKHIK